MLKKITDNIYAVGAVDRDVRIFHGYQTPFGTTYNAYLIIDEKVTLIDFVKAPFAGELVETLVEILGDREIDYLICNHVEPDHSGALPLVVKKYPKAVVFGTLNCQKELKAYYPEAEYEFRVVKLGDSLNTGKYNFNFIPMPMIHWPDSMSTYLVEEAMLFSNDAFGQHIGTGVFSDKEMSYADLLERMANYYANIVLPFGGQVIKYFTSLEGYPIKVICPSHGVILEDHVDEILCKYDGWANNVTDDKSLVIIYDTMWGTTKKMADCLARDYLAKGFNVQIVNLSEEHYSIAIGKLLEAKYIFVGSSTLNNGILPSVSAFLTYMKGLKPKNRIGKAFGSYGWSGESVNIVNESLMGMGFEMLELEKALWNIEC